MTIDYKKKYIELVKLYHELHTEITLYQLTVKKLGEELIPVTEGSEGVIKGIDGKFRELIKNKNDRKCSVCGDEWNADTNFECSCFDKTRKMLK